MGWGRGTERGKQEGRRARKKGRKRLTADHKTGADSLLHDHNSKLRLVLASKSREDLLHLLDFVVDHHTELPGTNTVTVDNDTLGKGSSCFVELSQGVGKALLQTIDKLLRGALENHPRIILGHFVVHACDKTSNGGSDKGKEEEV